VIRNNPIQGRLSQPAANPYLETCRILKFGWTITNIYIPIHPSFEANGILRDEPSELRVVKARAVVKLTTQLIAFAAGETISCTCATGAVAVTIIRDSLDEFACGAG